MLAIPKRSPVSSLVSRLQPPRNVGFISHGFFGSINIAADGSYTYTVDNNNPTVQALRTTANTLTDVFTYTMRDTAGLTSTTQITVTIQGANDAPSDITGTLTIAENSANTTSVGTLSRVDIDAGDGATFALTDNAGGRFAINSSTGQVTVANGSLLNFEANTSHTIVVQVTDTAGYV
jgi:VCBS repeat-containing protein